MEHREFRQLEQSGQLDGGRRRAGHERAGSYARDTATFGAAATSGSVAVTLNNTSPQVSALTFSGTNRYALLQGSGTGELTLSAPSGPALVTVTSGSHLIAVPLVLAGNVEIDPAAGTRLAFPATSAKAAARRC